MAQTMRDPEDAALAEISADSTVAAVAAGTSVAEERVSVASQWQLMWWRFRKHKLAMVAAVIVMLFYAMVILADFLAYADPEVSDAQRGLIAPQPIVWFDPDTGGFFPHVPGLVGKRDPLTFKRVYAPDPSVKVPIAFFAEGFDYKLFGFIPTNRHLIGPGDGSAAEQSIFILGTDIQGRDMWSRLMYATRVSLVIGLVGVTVSLVLGVVLGRPLRLLRRLARHHRPARHRDPALDPDHPALDGPGRRRPAGLERPPGLLRHHDHHLADRLDGACARRAREVPLAARGRLRDGGRAVPAATGRGSSSSTWCRSS